MTDFEVGDEIEITYRGVVEDKSPNYFMLNKMMLNHVTPSAEVKVIKKRKPQVGDKLTTVEQLEALPPNAVLVDRFQDVFRKHSIGHKVFFLAGIDGPFCAQEVLERKPTLIYLPPSAR